MLGPGGSASADQVRALQRNLRAPGGLRGGIDGLCGNSVTRAARALQHDPLHTG